MKYPKNRKYHGMTKTPIYKVWAQMIYRCHDENHDCYADYGGRGISVCGRWREFSLFFDDMGLPPSRRHSLDRINNNGNYEPTNCRWSLPDKFLEDRI